MAYYIFFVLIGVLLGVLIFKWGCREGYEKGYFKGYARGFQRGILKREGTQDFGNQVSESGTEEGRNKERERLETIWDNINAYDGTGAGQKDVNEWK